MKFRFLGAFATALLIGCGSDDSPTVEVDDGSVADSIGTDDTGGTISDTGGTTDDTGGTVGDTGGVTADTGGTTSDTGGTADAPPSTSMIACGAASCDSKTQECCITGGIGSCVSKGAACGGVRYGCTSVDTCASGQVCCTSGAGSGGASCAASASCPTATTCKSNADCSGKLKNCKDLGFIKICST